jgi:hypothetical protein
MAKQKKKRDKVYKGSNAAMTRPTVTRIEAVNRNAVGQWWFDHKRIARPVLIGVGIATLVVILIIEIIRLV